MMFVLLLLFPLMMVNGSNEICENSCETVTNIESVSNMLSPLLKPFENFLREHHLENEHTALQKVLLELGVKVTVDQDSPVEAFVLHHQKILAENVENYITEKIEKLKYDMTAQFDYKIENMAVYLAQKLDANSEKMEKMENIIKNTISNESKKISEKQDYNFEKLENNIISTVSTCCCNQSLLIPPSDCLDILRNGETHSGVYTIYPHGLEFKVYCDMETDGGGWTVFLIRQDQAIRQDFKKDWSEYKNGFGTPPNEYWMGNEALHRMTTSKNYSMRAEATCPEGSPTNVWSEFSFIRVESEEQEYRLTLFGRNEDSTIDDFYNFKYNNGMKFSTFDQENDSVEGVNCAEQGEGAFWYSGPACSYIYPTVNLYGMYFARWSTTDATARYATQMNMKIRTQT